MNCPELIAKLALENIISKELSDRMLDAAKDALLVAYHDVKPVLLVDIDTTKQATEHPLQKQ